MREFVAQYWMPIICGAMIAYIVASNRYRIFELEDQVKRLKELDVKYIREDVSDLKRERYDYMARLELTTHLASLHERISITETRLQERKKD